MLLPLHQGLRRTWKFDPEMAELFDRHYSRQTVGSRQFMGNGKTLILRNNEGTILFGWLWQPLPRRDGQVGYNCSVFRNESTQKSSEIILEAETLAVQHWGENRAFTYVDGSKIRSKNPGCCFKKAGWKQCGVSPRGLLIFEKWLKAA